MTRYEIQRARRTYTLGKYDPRYDGQGQGVNVNLYVAVRRALGTIDHANYLASLYPPPPYNP